MKQILLLRHAKSSWDDESLKDFDRPLAKRGRNDASRMGDFVRKLNIKPSIIISSPAARAKETALLFAKAAKCEEEIIEWKSGLYYGTSADYLETIKNVSNNCETVLLVGHNPLIENTAGTLVGESNGISITMPTAALVMLTTYVPTWKQVNWGTCELNWMMIPKALKKIMK